MENAGFPHQPDAAPEQAQAPPVPDEAPPEPEASVDVSDAPEEAEAEQAEVADDAPTPAPGPLRPPLGATNPKVAGPPPVADQPGLGRAANEYDAPGQSPNLSTDRVGAEIKRRRERAAEHAKSVPASSDEG